MSRHAVSWDFHQWNVNLVLPVRVSFSARLTKNLADIFTSTVLVRHINFHWCEINIECWSFDNTFRRNLVRGIFFLCLKPPARQRFDLPLIISFPTDSSGSTVSLQIYLLSLSLSFAFVRLLGRTRWGWRTRLMEITRIDSRNSALCLLFELNNCLKGLGKVDGKHKNRIYNSLK